MTETTPEAVLTPALPGEAYARRHLPMLLRDVDARQALLATPDFKACPLRGMIACLTNLLLIERAMLEASRLADRPRWDELERAHGVESGWLGSFQVLDRIRSTT